MTTAYEHQHEDRVGEAQILHESSLRARIGEVGNQIHNIGCELQDDDLVADRLEELSVRLWGLAQEASPAPVDTGEGEAVKCPQCDFGLGGHEPGCLASDAAKEIERLCDETGCLNRDDLVDMARVGRDLMVAIGEVPDLGWSNSPSEVVIDLANKLHDAEAEAASLSEQLAEERARVERLRYVMDGVAGAIDTGRHEPLVVWREQIEIARAALSRDGGTNA